MHLFEDDEFNANGQVDVPGDESEGLAFWEKEIEAPLLPAPTMNWAEGATGPCEDVVKVTAFHVEHNPCKPAYGCELQYKCQLLSMFLGLLKRQR